MSDSPDITNVFQSIVNGTSTGGNIQTDTNPLVNNETVENNSSSSNIDNPFMQNDIIPEENVTHNIGNVFGIPDEVETTESNDSDFVETNVKFELNKFSSLLDILGRLKESCFSIDIKNGILRQRSKDSQCFYDIDFTTIMDPFSLRLNQLKLRLDMLNVLLKHNKEVEFFDKEKHYTFKTSGNFEIKKIDIDYLDSTSVFVENTKDMSKYNIIGKIKFDTMTVATIEAFKKLFNTDRMSLTFSENGSTLVLESKSEKMILKPEINIPNIDKSFIGNSVDVLIDPLLISNQECELTLYDSGEFSADDSNGFGKYIFFMYETSKFNVPIKIYTNSVICSDK